MIPSVPNFEFRVSSFALLAQADFLLVEPRIEPPGEILRRHQRPPRHGAADPRPLDRRERAAGLREPLF
jgi:hypothetical protein